MNIGKNFFWMAIIFSALLLACSPTEVSAQSPSNEQRLVGSWTDLHNNSTVVFSADGTVSGLRNVFNSAPTVLHQATFIPPTHWAAAGNTLVLFTTYENLRGSVIFNISTDGRTLTFTAGTHGGINNLAFRRN